MMCLLCTIVERVESCGKAWLVWQLDPCLKHRGITVAHTLDSVPLVNIFFYFLANVVQI